MSWHQACKHAGKPPDPNHAVIKTMQTDHTPTNINITIYCNTTVYMDTATGIFEEHANMVRDFLVFSYTLLIMCL
jgi:hypothetical protein